MLEIIKQIVDFRNIGIDDENRIKLEIKDAIISEETKCLHTKMEANFVMPIEDMDAFRRTLIAQIKGITGIEIDMTYTDLIQDKLTVIKFITPHVINKINGNYSHLTKTIYHNDYDIDVNSIKIYALGETTVEQLNKELARKFEFIYEEEIGYKVDVYFENKIQDYQKIGKKIEEKEQEAIKDEKIRNQTNSGKTNENMSTSSKGKGGYKRESSTKNNPAKGDLIMGGRINTVPINIQDVTPESGLVAVEGEVFKKEARTTKTDNKLISIFITNKISSITLKSFVSEKKWEEIDGLVSNGDAIRVKGDAQWDKYDNTTIIMIKNIEKIEKKIRMDNSEEKRVELHAHTKMSAMDGLNVTAQMVRNAEKWGHKAIAITDHGVVQAFPDASHAGKDIKILYGCEGYLLDDKDLIADDGSIAYKAKNTNHVIIFAKDRIGLKNLYRLVSISHLDYFYKRPRIPKSILSKYREGLIIGSACEAGELYQAIHKKRPDDEIREIVEFYDYLEIQPIVNNKFLIRKGEVSGEEELRESNKKILELGRKYNKLVVATCDSHYFDPEDALYRRILMAGQGYKDIEGDEGLYFRTTEEMLDEFMYLGEEDAYEVVIKNPNMIADMIEEIKPVPDGKFPPKIDGAEEDLKKNCEQRVKEQYGNDVPVEIRERLDKELNSIIDNGYAVMYRSAELLVKKSLEDGYLVGSRGSVGSSFAATMSGITEVNPLDPHYLCPKCKNVEWGDKEKYDCGVDMPDKICPICNTPYKKEGFTIPFETFLGFEANKEPDIDLNFAGEYQAKAQKYVEEIFGRENVYKAGTISAVQDKIAFGYIMKYFEERGISVCRAEIERLIGCCAGVKKTSGQHPGGIIIVPKGHEIYDFCPVQHPANDIKTDIITTHFDYHSIDKNLLKLDILGHDAPSMIRKLEDMTGVDPSDVPIKDAKVMSIFNGVEGLDLKDENYPFTHGSYGIPEFGTKFVRQMLDDTSPTTFADLVRISGFSHGTDVWINNARDLIVSNTATMKDAISTRDDIMNYLRLKGVPNKDAFEMMEKVRKGKGLTAEQEELMRSNNVPEWYIESCQKIKYMFPRAHAVAYVMMSNKIAYYKVYHPLAFYAVYFSTKVAFFNEKVIMMGKDAVYLRFNELMNKGKDISKKEEDEIAILEVAYEMLCRGYEFEHACLGESDADNFKCHNGKVILPFVAINGIGIEAAKSLVDAYRQGPFETIEEILDRTKINKTGIEELKAHGVLEGLPETAQMTLFG